MAACNLMTPLKRSLDIFFSALLMVLMGPVILYLIWKIWRQQGAPVFYVAERMKTPTRSFGLIKFRTMTVVEDDKGVSGANKASRVTPLGAKLRARRLDEFPQLWNIFRGDLSFVGPRPPLREYVDRFPETYARVLQTRPGVTGLATLRFHKHEERLLARCATAEETDDVYTRICVPRKAHIDLIYQENRNICYDVLLVFETIATLWRTRR